MANENFNVAQKSLLGLDFGSIQVQLNKGKNPKQCVNITFTQGDLVKTISTSAFNGSQFKDLYLDVIENGISEKIENCSMARAMVERAWDRGNDDEQIRTYVKKSYALGKEKLAVILDTALNDCSYSKELIAKFETFDYSKTSAVLYRGNYVTPCMLEIVISEWLKANGQETSPEKEKAILKRFFELTA